MRHIFSALALSLCGLVATAFAEGPQRFSLNVHNNGSLRQAEVLSEYEPAVDMLRIGNKPKFPGRNNPLNSAPENIVNLDDPVLYATAKKFGWERILLGIGDKRDDTKPSIESVVNDEQTGFAQRTVRAFPYVEYVQLFNEHCNFDKICGGEYVLYLKPFYEWVHLVENPRRARVNERRKDDPGFIPFPMVKVVSSASHGQTLGPAEAFYDFQAGMIFYCDVIGMHDYTGANAIMYARFRQELSDSVQDVYDDIRASLGLPKEPLTDKPIWVTETGKSMWHLHDEWLLKEAVQIEEDINRGYTGTMPQHIFWYSAFEGNGPNGATPGLDQYGLFVYDQDSWTPTNEEMNNLIMERIPDDTDDGGGRNLVYADSIVRRSGGRVMP